MPAARYDLHIEQGATYYKPIIIKVSNVPFDLTNWTATGQIRKTHRSDTIIAEFSFDVPTTGAALTDGAMTIKLTPLQTGAIVCGELETDSRSKYVYDIELTHSGTGGGFAAGEIKRLLEGFAYVSPEVTREP